MEFSHRTGRDLIDVAKRRSNIIPIVEDARHPHKYRMLVGMVDTIFSDVAQPDQARIVALNAHNFLKSGGHFVISIKVKYLRLCHNCKVYIIFFFLIMVPIIEHCHKIFVFLNLDIIKHNLIISNNNFKAINLIILDFKLYLYLFQASCIDSLAQPEAVFASEVKKLIADNLKPQEQITLEPYERDHAVVVGVFRPPPKKAS